MKFMHAADLHLDRSFEGISQMTGEVAERLAEANEQMLKNIVNLCKKEEIDFLILAGDTFHQATPSLQTQHIFMAAMNELKAARIPVFLTFGNHDYYLPEKYWFTFPSNVYAFTNEKVETVAFRTRKDEKIALSAFSYQSRWIETDKVPEFPARLADVTAHIGIYHGSVGGGNQHRYAPFQVGEMQSKGYDYWALGHIHEPQTLSENILYAGTPQGHSIKEVNPQGIVLVEQDGPHLNTSWQSVAAVEWQQLDCSLAAAQERSEVIQCIWQALADAPASEKFQLIALRLTNLQHLSLSVRDSLANSSFLAELLQIMPSRLREKGTLVKLSLAEEISSEGLPLGLTPQLLSFIGEDFKTSERFEIITSDLRKQTLLAPFIDHAQAKRAELVISAEEAILESFKAGEERANS